MIGPDRPPRVSIVVVTYNSAADLPACLESIDRQGVPVELFAIDNASSDATRGMLRARAAEHRNLHVILNARNLGLAFANNQALGKAVGEHVLFLNPDTVLRDGALRALVGYLDEHPDVSVVGPRNVSEDGTPHLSYFKRWTVGHVLLWRMLPNAWLRRLHDRHARYREGDVLFVSGACLLIRRSDFERIGGYDPQYFLTVEDVCDLCIRVRRAGGRVVYYPAVEVMHMRGRSGATESFLVAWEGLRGSVYHLGKHHGLPAALWVTALFVLKNLLWGFLALLLSPLRPRWIERARRNGRLAWKLMTENPLQKRNLHAFSPEA